MENKNQQDIEAQGFENAVPMLPECLDKMQNLADLHKACGDIPLATRIVQLYMFAFGLSGNHDDTEYVFEYSDEICSYLAQPDTTALIIEGACSLPHEVIEETFDILPKYMDALALQAIIENFKDIALADLEDIDSPEFKERDTQVDELFSVWGVS